MSVKERVKQFIKQRGITIRAFEESIGASNGYVNSISKGIGSDKLERIIELYPNVNIDWILFGQGEMLTPNKKDQKGAGSPDGEAAGKITSLEKEVELLRKQLSQTREHLKTLKEFNEMLKEQLGHDGEGYNRKAN